MSENYLRRASTIILHGGRRKDYPAALLKHTVLHDDFVVDFHQHASASIPKSWLAGAVARAGARDHVRQPRLAAVEAHIDELIFWQLELSHHRLPVRAAKTQPFLACFLDGLSATEHYRQSQCGKTPFADSSHHPKTTHAFDSNFSKAYSQPRALENNPLLFHG